MTSASKAPRLTALGAAKTIDRDEDFVSALGAGEIDVVVDLVAGAKWPSLLDLLRPGGRYAVAGAIAGPIVELDVRTLYLKDLSFFGCTVLDPEVFGALVGRIEREEIAPLVAETYPLREIAAAKRPSARRGASARLSSIWADFSVLRREAAFAIAHDPEGFRINQDQDLSPFGRPSGEWRFNRIR